MVTRSPAVAKIGDRTGCQWPWRSSKVDDFHLIWKDVCDFPLVINSNLSQISHRFQDMATYILKLFAKNCGQTAANGDMVSIHISQPIGSRQRPLPDGTIADPVRLTA